VGAIVVNDLMYSHPGGDLLFSEVSFRVPAGRCAGIVGANGAGKTTLLRILAGELAADSGSAALDGESLYMPQDLGASASTIRELMLRTAPQHLRAAGQRLLAAEQALAGDDASAGIVLGEAVGQWSDYGGYELEGQWDAACRRVLGLGLSDVGDRPQETLSGGERKRLVLDLLFASTADILLLDEPDNFLDIRGKRWFEERVAQSRKTILLISHDREVLTGSCDLIVTLEGRGCWVHGGSYSDYAQARDHRQRLLGARLAHWREEERRLHELVKTFKERARYSSDWAKRADAAETRWKRFVSEGPPEAPAVDRKIRPRLRGGESARRAVVLEHLGLPALVQPFSDEIHLGERVGLIGPNGTGKTHLMRLLGGEPVAHEGSFRLGNRVTPGLFTQHSMRADWEGKVVDEVRPLAGTREGAMGALARYGLQDAANRDCQTLSGGQRARLEILCLELRGHNLLLLDEPTDNLDVASAEALEEALESFEGTVVAVSHDRSFLRKLDRFLMLEAGGSVRPIPDAERALEAMMGPAPSHVA
jgi:ATPase subunit of ABC transporter with duplicated ATPase domains